MRLEGESTKRSKSPLPGSLSATNGKVRNGYTNGKADANSSSSPSSSSHKHTNGTNSLRPSPDAVWHGHNREELTRILIQCLDEMGYSNAARELCRESNYELEGPAVAAFRNAVLQGDWPEAEALLFGPENPDQFNTIGGGKDAGSKGSEVRAFQGHRGLPLVEGVNKKEMLFWLRQQKFLELLEKRDLPAALLVLRQELTPLNEGMERVHFLGGLIMCPDVDDLKIQATWDGADGQSRHLLLSELSKSISPSVMIPENRLAVLLDEVKAGWVQNCLYHNTYKSPSLYHDHICDESEFPNRSLHELRYHEHEVWFLAFSNNGKKLASASRDRCVNIYDVESNFKLEHTLPEHEAGVCYVAWSPDDTKLLTCTRERDNSVRVWNTADATLLLHLTEFESPTTVATWTPDGQSFIIGSLDTKHAIEVWNLEEELIYRWKEDKLRVYDMALSPDGRRLVALLESRILVYDFNTRQKIGDWQFDDGKMTSLAISQDSQLMLIASNPNKIRLMRIDTGEVVQIFEGHKQQEYMIRSAFGGANQTFVISGSEDSRVYIWRTTGQLIEALEGHREGCVNAVAWHPTNPSIFATAGDDHNVRIWSTERWARNRASLPQQPSISYR